VNVTRESGGYDYFPSDRTITENKVTKGTGNYAGIFSNYAYVTYTFKFINFMNREQDLSVTVRVSESGNKI